MTLVFFLFIIVSATSRDNINHCILTRAQNRYGPMIYTIWDIVGTSYDL